MKKHLGIFSLFLAFFPVMANAGVVTTYGQLYAEGSYIKGAAVDTAVQVRGVSLGWSNTGWGSDFFIANTVDHMVDDWDVEVIRAPLGVSVSEGAASNGYLLDSAANINRVMAVVDEAILKDIYVIIDWHSHNAESELEKSLAFFRIMAEKYGDYANVIFEVYNEPNWAGYVSSGDSYTSWDTIKNYAQTVIDTIRHYSDNLVLVGTPMWDQQVNAAVEDTIVDSNVGYVFHFYAASHSLSSYQSNILAVLNAGHAVFVSEYGTTNADGGQVANGTYNSHNATSSDAWLTFMDSHKLSSCAWNANDTYEGSAFFGIDSEKSFDPTSTNASDWTNTSKMTASGQYIYGKLTGYASCSDWRGTTDCSSSSSVVTTGATIWQGSDESGQVSTGGWWSSYTDSNDGGFSTTDFPEDSIGQWIAENGDLLNVNLTLKSGYDYPYVGLGFNWLDPLAEHNISAEKGLCVEYALTGNAPTYLVLRNSEAQTGFNYYKVTLNTTTEIQQLYFAWTDFSQESGWGSKLDRTTALETSLGLEFQAKTSGLTGSDSLSSNLKIRKINFGACSGEGSSSSGEIASSSSSSSAGFAPVAGLDTLWLPAMGNAGLDTVVEGYGSYGPYTFQSAGTMDSSRSALSWTAEFSIESSTWAGGGIGFNLAVYNDTNYAVDMSGIGGVCVSYSSDFDSAYLSVGQDYPDVMYGETLDSAEEQTNIYVPFSSLSIPSYASATMDQATLLKNVKNVQIRVPDAAGSYTFHLYGLGFADSQTECTAMFVASSSVASLTHVDGYDTLWEASTKTLYSLVADSTMTLDVLASEGTVTASITDSTITYTDIALNTTDNWTGGGISYTFANNNYVDISDLGGVCVSYVDTNGFGYLSISHDSWPNVINSDKLPATTSQPKTFYIPFAAFTKTSDAVMTRTGILDSAINLQYRSDKAGSYSMELQGIGFAANDSACKAMFPQPLSSGVLWAYQLGNYGNVSQIDTVFRTTPGGYWFSGSDSAWNDSGNSYVIPTNAEGELADSIIDKGYLKTEFHILPGYSSPYAAVGFNWREDEKPYDLAWQKGVCLTYASSADVNLALNGNYDSYNNYEITVPASSEWTTATFNFEDFSQYYSGNSPDLDSVLADSVTGFLFRARGKDTNIVLNVAQIGWAGSCSSTDAATAGLAVDLHATMDNPQLVWSPDTHGEDDTLKSVIGGSWVTFDDAVESGTSEVQSATAAIFGKAKAAVLAARVSAGGYAGLHLNYRADGSAYSVKAKDGFCMTYRSSRNFQMQMDENDTIYSAAIAASSIYKTIRIGYEKFSHLSGNGTLDLSRQTGVDFVFSSNADSSATLEINQFGFGDACDLSDIPATGTVYEDQLVYDVGSDADTQIHLGTPDAGGLWFTFDDGISVVSPETYTVALRDSAGVIPFVAEMASAGDTLYAGNGFNWLGSGADIDLSGVANVCVTYRSTADFDAVFRQSYTSNDNPYAYTLPAQSTFMARSIPLDSLKQQTGLNYTQVLDLLRQHDLRFMRRGSVAGTTDTLEIAQVGIGDVCTNLNLAPVVVGAAVNDSILGYFNASLTINEEDTIRIPQSAFLDREGDSLSFSFLNSVDSVTYSRIGDTLVIVPAKDLFGSLNLKVSAADIAGNIRIWPIALTLLNVNDAPVIASVRDTSTAEDNTVTLTKSLVTASDVDNDSTDLSLVVYAGVDYSVLNNIVTPSLNYNGTLSVPVAVTDGTDTSVVDTVKIEVTAVNDAPVIASVRDTSTAEDKAVTLTKSLVTVSDVDGDALTLVVYEGTNYTLSGAKVTPSLNYNGTLSVPVVVTDGTDTSVVDTVKVQVTAVNDAPDTTTAKLASTTFQEEKILTISGIAALFTDVDGDLLTYTLATSSGKIAVNNALKTVTGVKDSTGSAVITLTADDGNLSVSRNFTLTIQNVNDAPVIASVRDTSTAEDKAVTLTKSLVTVSDADGDALTLVVYEGTNYTLSGAKVTPSLNYNGTLSVPVAVTDGTDTSVVDTVKIEVQHTTVIATVIPSGVLTGNLFARLENGMLNLHYSISRAGSVTLELYSMRGQKVFSIAQGHEEVGNYELNVDTVRLPPSVYMGVLRVDGKVSVKRTLVVR